MSYWDPTTKQRFDVAAAKAAPCAHCPWRVSNWGRTDSPHPEYNTPERRDQMWDVHPERPPETGVRFGNGMMCHQTDGNHHRRDCAGADVLRQRELVRYLVGGAAVLAPANPQGLTIDGVRWVMRAIDENPQHGLRPFTWDFSRLWGRLRTDLDDPAFQHHQLTPPRRGEFRRRFVERSMAERLQREGVDKEWFGCDAA